MTHGNDREADWISNVYQPGEDSTSKPLIMPSR